MTAEVPARTVPGIRGTDTERKRDGSRSSLVADVLGEVIAARAAQSGRPALDIVDVGAGTGGLAVSFAREGHRVTVVDPSPDALAAARWRAAETGVTLTEVQGEAGDLPTLVGTAAADLVICHSVLEYVDSPSAALAAIARVLRPGGTVSVLAANTVAAVLQRALAGKYAEARAMLPGSAQEAKAQGAQAEESVALPTAAAARRFTLPELTALIEGAGLRAGDAHGIRIFSSLLHSTCDQGAAADPAAADALRELEDAAAAFPPLRDIATRLHVLGYRGTDRA